MKRFPSTANQSSKGISQRPVPVGATILLNQGHAFTAKQLIIRSTMCNVNGCDRPIKARGLCAMHYPRWRRTGDPEEVRRAGRPRDEMLDDLRERFAGTWSPRTTTRYKRVMQLCSLCCSGEFSISELEKHPSETGNHLSAGIHRASRSVGDTSFVPRDPKRVLRSRYP